MGDKFPSEISFNFFSDQQISEGSFGSIPAVVRIIINYIQFTSNGVRITYNYQASGTVIEGLRLIALVDGKAVATIFGFSNLASQQMEFNYDIKTMSFFEVEYEIAYRTTQFINFSLTGKVKIYTHEISSQITFLKDFPSETGFKAVRRILLLPPPQSGNFRIIKMAANTSESIDAYSISSGTAEFETFGVSKLIRLTSQACITLISSNNKWHVTSYYGGTWNPTITNNTITDSKTITSEVCYGYFPEGRDVNVTLPNPTTFGRQLIFIIVTTQVNDGRSGKIVITKSNYLADYPSGTVIEQPISNLRTGNVCIGLVSDGNKWYVMSYYDSTNVEYSKGTPSPTNDASSDVVFINTNSIREIRLNTDTVSLGNSSAIMRYIKRTVTGTTNEIRLSSTQKNISVHEISLLKATNSTDVIGFSYITTKHSGGGVNYFISSIYPSYY